MSTRRVLNETGNVALELLRSTAASADVFPPLKSVAGGVLHIAEIIEVCFSISSTARLLTYSLRNLTLTKKSGMSSKTISRMLPQA